MRAKDDAILHDELDRGEEGRVDEVAETFGSSRRLHKTLDGAQKTLEERGLLEGEETCGRRRLAFGWSEGKATLTHRWEHR